MIEAYVGLPGSGKTLLAVARLLAEKKRKRIANFYSKFGEWDFALWEDMREAGNALCVVDEAHMWFSARTWNKQTQADLAVFQQHRKWGLDMIWIAQHESRVDVAIREVTAYVYRIRRIGGFCLIRKFEPGETKPLNVRFWRMNKGLFGRYWTEQVIGDRDGNGFEVPGSEATDHDRREGAGGALPGAVRIVPGSISPSVWRVEGPFGPRYVSEAARDSECERAVRAWVSEGRAMDPAAIVEGLWRDRGGRWYRFVEPGLIVPLTVPVGPLELVRRAWIDVVLGRTELEGPGVPIKTLQRRERPRL